MKCGECNYRYVFHTKYGNMNNTKYAICSFKPKLRNHIDSKPKWCPIKKDKEKDNG